MAEDHHPDDERAIRVQAAFARVVRASAELQAATTALLETLGYTAADLEAYARARLHVLEAEAPDPRLGGSTEVRSIVSTRAHLVALSHRYDGDQSGARHGPATSSSATASTKPSTSSAMRRSRSSSPRSVYPLLD
jgi:hypothetical protein